MDEHAISFGPFRLLAAELASVFCGRPDAANAASSDAGRS
jgi:hypothetical protein